MPLSFKTLCFIGRVLTFSCDLDRIFCIFCETLTWWLKINRHHVRKLFVKIFWRNYDFVIIVLFCILFCCNFCTGDSTSGQRALYEVGMTGIPIYNVNNNCSTGSTALILAKQLIESGNNDCVLALGFEKMERGSLMSKVSV